MSYIPFTEQQREQARRTDLAAFLRQCGEEVKRSGSENMWLDHGQKVTIRGNLWFHQYEQVGGDTIDFACRFYNMEYPEAVQLMLAIRGFTTPSTPIRGATSSCWRLPICRRTGSGRRKNAAVSGRIFSISGRRSMRWEAGACISGRRKRCFCGCRCIPLPIWERFPAHS